MTCTVGMGGCGAHFCCMCLESAASSAAAHAHVSGCRYKPRPGDVFGQPANGGNTRAMRRAALDRAQSYLSSLPAKLREDLLADARCVALMRDLRG